MPTKSFHSIYLLRPLKKISMASLPFNSVTMATYSVKKANMPYNKVSSKNSDCLPLSQSNPHELLNSLFISRTDVKVLIGERNYETTLSRDAV